MRCMICRGNKLYKGVQCPVCLGTGNFFSSPPPKLDKMKVLVACEFSGIVRDAFIEQGHDAISCDYRVSERKGPHYVGNVFDLLYSGEWDLMIAHPPCTHLAVSGAAWFYYKKDLQVESLKFVRELMDAPIARICIENPVSIISTNIRKPDQIINPFQYGHPISKATCLWLKGLSPLQPTAILDRYTGIQKIMHGDVEKSRTFPNIAKAMATQWG